MISPGLSDGLTRASKAPPPWRFLGLTPPSTRRTNQEASVFMLPSPQPGGYYREDQLQWARLATARVSDVLGDLNYWTPRVLI